MIAVEVQVRTYGMSVEQQDALWSAWRAGDLLSRVARTVGVPLQHVRRYLAQTGGVRRPPPQRSPRHLSRAEREEISRGVTAGLSARAIAARLGRASSSVTRELARNGGRGSSRAVTADEAASRRAGRPKPAKLAVTPALREVVEAKLGLQWSPEQIAAWLRQQYPDDPVMQVSHETIYMSLFVQTRGALKQQLTRELRTHRPMRRPIGHRRGVQGRGVIRNMVSIRERPAEVADRAVPGHWEGDLVFGRRPGAVATLVERHSRFLLLVALPDGITATAVRPHLAQAVSALPAQLRRSLTWDRGREMADLARFSVDTGVQVYFCDPKSPWQRGSNEQTNRLLRQHLPKTDDLRRHTQADLDAIADRLNTRPRETLQWRTPAQVMATALRG